MLGRYKSRVITSPPNQDTNSEDLSFQSLGVDGFPCTFQQSPESVHSHDKCQYFEYEKLKFHKQINCAWLIWAFSRFNSEITWIEKQ